MSMKLQGSEIPRSVFNNKACITNAIMHAFDVVQINTGCNISVPPLPKILPQYGIELTTEKPTALIIGSGLLISLHNDVRFVILQVQGHNLKEKKLGRTILFAATCNTRLGRL